MSKLNCNRAGVKEFIGRWNKAYLGHQVYREEDAGENCNQSSRLGGDHKLGRTVGGRTRTLRKSTPRSITEYLCLKYSYASCCNVINNSYSVSKKLLLVILYFVNLSYGASFNLI